MLDEEARQQCLDRMKARRQRVWVMVPSRVKVRPVVIGAGWQGI
jgi:hypothetical protein